MDKNQDLRREDGEQQDTEQIQNADIKEIENDTDCSQDSKITENNNKNDPQNEKTEAPKRKLISVLYDYVEIFAASVIAVILIFSFSVRLCRVDGGSMNQTLNNGERLIVSDMFYTPKQGDIIVFHLVNDYYQEPLVKRVIATEGQTVEIDFEKKTIKVDGVLYKDEHAYLDIGHYKSQGIFSATVPEGKVFVLGDNRNNSSDSRSIKVGFVDVDCILGKAVLRLSPFTILY